MISILYPEILAHLRDLHYGLLPFYNAKTGESFLVIKATKEGILTVKTNNQFKVYLVKDPSQRGVYLGVISAFFDDHDEPLNLSTPLFSEDDMVREINAVFSQPEFDIYFFDENNYELLGVRAKNRDCERFVEEMNEASFNPFDPLTTLANWQQMGMVFGQRSPHDDQQVFALDCSERLYPDDVFIMDTRDKFHGFNDRPENIVSLSLDRDGDPGPMQEKEIARLLLRLLDASSVYVNPIRSDTGLELTDIMVVTDDIMFFVQAKDSPNTEEMLQRSIDRKRSTVRKQIKKASNQMRGAFSYARENNGVTIKTQDGGKSISLVGRQLIGLIVVKELFDDDYKECSTPILKLVREMDLPVGLFDYSQLNVLTLKFESWEAFIDGLYLALDMALEHEQFPISVHSGILREHN